VGGGGGGGGGGGATEPRTVHSVHAAKALKGSAKAY